MPRQQHKRIVAKYLAVLLLTILIALAFLPQFTSSAVYAEQSRSAQSLRQGETAGMSNQTKRLLFQCGMGVALSVVLTVSGPMIGLYIPKLLTLWRLSKEVRAAIIAAEATDTALTAAREAQLTQQMVDAAVSAGADEVATNPAMAQRLQESAQAQEKVQQARDARSSFHRDTVEKMIEHIQSSLISNALFTCTDLFSIPLIDRLAYTLWPDDPGSNPSSKELKPGSNTDSSQSLDPSDADIDQLFSQTPDQLCSDLSTTYDTASDSCGGGDQAVISAYTQVANLGSDTSLISDTSLAAAGATASATDGSTTPDTSGQTSTVQNS